MKDKEKAKKQPIDALAAVRQRVAGLENDLVDCRAGEEALKTSRGRTRTSFEHTLQFTGLITTVRALAAANRTALSFVGVEESKVFGKPCWETPWCSHSPDLQEEWCTAITKAAAGKCMRFEATHLRVAGKRGYVDFSLKPVMDESGNVVLPIPDGRDTTERNLIEELFGR